MICQFKIKVNKVNLDDVVNVAIKTAKLKALDDAKIEENLEDIKKRILDSTEEYINSHRRRPADSSKTHLIDVLRETTFIEKLDDYTWRLNVGNTDDLDEKTPYWYIVNYGGIISAKGFKGIFGDGPPTVGGGGNTWFEGETDDDGKMYFMSPSKPIPPMHYLNHMAQVFLKEIKQYKSKAKK